MYTADDLNNVLGLIEFAWREGGVRSEAQASAFHNLKNKTQQLLNPQPTAPTSPAAGGKKGKDDCCGGKHKEPKEKPKGPPKTAAGDEKKEAPKEEAKAEG